MQVQEILIVKNAHENYGISTEDINQISRVPALMPLPLRPSGVRGLCSVSGSVVSMVDMNILLDMPEIDLENPKSRLVSLNGALSSNTLLVSDVDNTVEINEKNIEYIETENDPVIAIYKHENILVQIISLEELFSKMNRVEIAAKEIGAGKVKESVDKEEDSIRFLIFSMANEKYALEIDYLQEIILADLEYTEIAGSAEDILGLITLREELLLIVDLRAYYGFEMKNSDENRVLVISYDNKKIGLRIDSIIDIQNFYKKDIEFMGDRLDDNKIAGVIHAKDSLISFFDKDVITEIFAQNDSFIDSDTNNKEIKVEEESVMEIIVFKLAGKEYAFNVDYVDEIIDRVPATDVSFTDAAIDGIINIRGQIVTIVSLFTKLHIEAVIDNDSKIIVCNIDGDKIGFVVDSVSDILDISEKDIVEEENKYFDSVLHLEDGKRLVLSMNIENILKKEPIDG